MKVRQLTVCSTCRSRKLGCDGKRPECSQCLFSGIKCLGYRADLIFRAPLGPGLPTERSQRGGSTAAVLEKTERRLNPTEHRIVTAGRNLSFHRLTWPLRDILSLCVQNFVPASELSMLSSNSRLSQPRICGAWVEVLPGLVDRGDHEPLSSAIKALGISLIARGRNGRAPIPDAIDAQCAALNALQRTMYQSVEFAYEELAAAVMCLFLSEMVLPTSNRSSLIHARGISELIQLRAPDFYATGVSHRLLIGFRPVLILYSFATHTSTFLADSEWQQKPFRLIPPTPLQALMSEASAIPAILEEVGDCKSRSTVAECVAQDAVLRYVGVLHRLDQWFQSAKESLELPLWWPAWGATGIKLSFPNITVANCLTHFWAFWIICVTQIRWLRCLFPELMGQQILVHAQSPESMRITQAILERSTRILQSAEYFTSDDMKFYGIASASFPLQTAWKALEMFPCSVGGVQPQNRRIVEMIVRKGLQDILIPDHANALDDMGVGGQSTLTEKKITQINNDR